MILIWCGIVGHQSSELSCRQSAMCPGGFKSGCSCLRILSSAWCLTISLLTSPLVELKPSHPSVCWHLDRFLAVLGLILVLNSCIHIVETASVHDLGDHAHVCHEDWWGEQVGKFNAWSSLILFYLAPRQLIISAFTHLQFQVAVDSRLRQEFIHSARQVKPQWLLRRMRGCLIGPQHVQWNQTGLELSFLWLLMDLHSAPIMFKRKID